METLVFQNIEFKLMGRTFMEADFDDSCYSKRQCDVIGRIRPVFCISQARDLGPITSAPLWGKPLSIVITGIMWVWSFLIFSFIGKGQ